jgi:hypothetical protein
MLTSRSCLKRWGLKCCRMHGMDTIPVASRMGRLGPGKVIRWWGMASIEVLSLLPLKRYLTGLKRIQIKICRSKLLLAC